MRTLFVFLLALSLCSSAIAQLNLNVQSIPAEEVPEAVKNSQTEYFPGLSVKLWEQHTASGPEQSANRFVASFQAGSRQAVRARYLSDGTGTTASTYYLSGTQFPSIIQSSAAQNYPDYTLNSGEKLQLLATGTTIFRLRLRNGAQKLVVYVDSNGNEIRRNGVPLEVRQEEDTD